MDMFVHILSSRINLRCLSFLVADELFAVDITLVKKVVRNMPVTPVPVALDAVAGIANINGRVVTVLSLASLFGHVNRNGKQNTQAVYIVVFKPFTETGAGDQMGFLIDKPGNLISIDEKTIFPPSIAADTEKNLCLLGIAEVEGQLYRIIAVDAVVKQFKNNRPMFNGSVENDEKN